MINFLDCKSVNKCTLHTYDNEYGSYDGPCSDPVDIRLKAQHDLNVLWKSSPAFKRNQWKLNY